MTIEALDAMLAAQRFACPCCGKSLDTTSMLDVKHKLAVDHDHATGRVRGVIHRGCNSAIGSLGDNAEGLRNAILYFEPDAPRVDEHW